MSNSSLPPHSVNQQAMEVSPKPHHKSTYISSPLVPSPGVKQELSALMEVFHAGPIQHSTDIVQVLYGITRLKQGRDHSFGGLR